MVRWNHGIECNCTKVHWQWFWDIYFEIFGVFLLELKTVPQSWIPKVHIGLKMALYNSNLFSINSCDLLPSSQYILLSWIPSYFCLVVMCFLQFSLWSRCNPKYLASSAWGTFRLFKITGGHISVRVVNVTCTDVASLTLILHFFSHFCIHKRPSRKRWDISIWFSWVARIAVSSA